jgi:2-methylcitrate dehydratase PrpD
MNRRKLLGASALAGLGLSAPIVRGAELKAAQVAISPEMQTLSRYMSEAGSRALPDEVAEQAKFHILDTLAAIISGSKLLPGQAAFKYITRHGGQGDRTVAASTLTTDAINAALANGVMAHSDETDDSHGRSRSHPGCAVVPAALAAGEEFGIDGRRFLHAVTLGYDVGTRVLMAMGGPTFSYESHKSSHSIGGVFGAAAAAACTANLSEQQMRWVLDYTAQQSSGIAAWGRDVDHIEKAFVFAGMPARSGVTSALLVESGWTGIGDIFSGPDNFFMAYAPNAKPSELVEQLGTRYEIALTDIKKWTVGSPIQGPLDAVQAIRKRHPFDKDQVKHVAARLGGAAARVVNNRDIPDICLQHMMAIMLVDGTVSFQAAHDLPRMKDPEVLKQRAKVELVDDEALSKLLPVRVAIVDITLNDGTVLSERITAVRGTPRNPMTKAEVIDKCRDLIAPILGTEKSARLIDTVFNIEALGNVRALRSLLQTS